MSLIEFMYYKSRTQITMKNILSILLITVALVSCNELELEPTGTITRQQLFKTDADALASVNGVYQALTYTDGEQALYGRNLYFLTDMGSDYAAAGSSASNYHVQSISRIAIEAGNDRVALVWQQIYNGINRANIAIDNIPNITGGDPVLRERLVNEAKFIRALLYFNVVRLWGDAPLVLHEAEELNNEVLKVGRTPLEKIYTQIFSDLNGALNLPPTYAAVDAGRPTGGAARALLAYVYLTRKEWRQASQTAQKIVDNADVYGYRLVDEFSDLFTKPAHKNGPEHVFSIQFEPGQSGAANTGNTLTSVSYFGPTPIEPADIPASDEIGYDRFVYNGTIKDKRRDVSYLKQTVVLNPVTGQQATYSFPRALFIKYVSDINKPYTQRGVDPVNFPLIRYSEVLLILAEALNEENNGPTPEAYEAINQVRRRAFGQLPYTNPSALPGVDLANLDRDGFRKAIQDERLFEFVQEGKRWFDLVRWGILVEEVSKVSFKSAVSGRNYLYPIPQEQRDLNPDELWQNEGY
jgi:hypothetical protein